MFKTTLSALTALSLGVVAAPALAETTSVKVSHADLDLSTPEGIATLEGRIQTAVKRICGNTEVRRIQDGVDQQQCVRETQTSVRLEVARLTANRPTLAINR